jgi:hypothetical protein
MRYFSKIKEDENYNHTNTLKYCEDYNLSLTQRLGKIAILEPPPISGRKNNSLRSGTIYEIYYNYYLGIWVIKVRV